MDYYDYFGERKYIVVFTADLARYLLKKGYLICDIRPDRDDPDHKRSVFIFLDEDELREDLRNKIEDRAKNRKFNEKRDIIKVSYKDTKSGAK